MPWPGLLGWVGVSFASFVQSGDVALIDSPAGLWVGGYVFDGEFDPGSGRTLAACLTHASRAERPFGVLERRTGE